MSGTPTHFVTSFIIDIPEPEVTDLDELAILMQRSH
jgi:hypothetical protein